MTSIKTSNRHFLPCDAWLALETKHAQRQTNALTSKPNSNKTNTTRTRDQTHQHCCFREPNPFRTAAEPLVILSHHHLSSHSGYCCRLLFQTARSLQSALRAKQPTAPPRPWCSHLIPIIIVFDAAFTPRSLTNLLVYNTSSLILSINLVAPCDIQVKHRLSTHTTYLNFPNK